MTVFIEAAMLTTMIIVGGMAAVTDIRKGIVPNKLVAIGFGFSVLLNLLLSFMIGITEMGTWFINMLLSDTLAIAMYANQMWAAGDAKLFAMMYALIPFEMLEGTSLSYSIVPYIFIFLPALGWITIDSLVRFIKREPRRAQKINIKTITKNWLFLSIEATAAFSLLGLIAPEFVANNALFCASLLLVYSVTCNSISWLRSIPSVLLHAAVLLVSILINPTAVQSPNLSTYPLIMAVILYQHAVSMYNYQLIPTLSVTKGMVLSADTIMSFLPSRVKGLPTNPDESLSSKITLDEAEAIKRWAVSSKGCDSIWIVRKVPFAIMIEIGFVIWVLVRMVL